MPGLKLVAELGGDGRGFEKMMDKASGAISGLGGHLAALFSIGAITAFTKETLDWAGALQDVADGLSVNVEWFQKMANGAALAGAKQEDLAKFLADLNKSRAESIAGGESGAQKTAAFGRLGISATDISSLNTEQFFQKLIDRFKNGMDAQGMNDLRDVGGRSARTLAAAFATQFQSDAPILSADMVSQLDTVGDKLTDFSKTLKVTFAPAIIWAVDKVTWAINKLKQVSAWLGARNAFKDGGAVDYNDTTGMTARQKAVLARAQKGKGWTFGGMDEAAGQAIVDEETRQRTAAAASEKARQASLAAARARAKAAPDFGDLIDQSDKSKKDQAKKDPERNLLTDRGDLFGRAGAMVNTVAQQQLAAANRAVAAQNETNRILREMQYRSPVSGTTPLLPPIR